MTTMYIVSAIILASVLTSIVFVLIGKIEHKNRHINLNWLLMMVVIVLATILTMVLIYHNQNDITPFDLQAAYEGGYEDGHADGWNDGYNETRTPSNEEMEEWFSSTKEVLVGTNKGGDMAIHIIDQNDEEWVLYADEVVTK